MFESKRELLLVEIERRCADAACNAPARVGLTKAEARSYDGFECERCERWHDDVLSERDVPEWWEELRVTGLDGVRPRSGGGRAEELSGAVRRLSDDWRRVRAEDEGGGEDPLA